jgi:hypothetical protein
MIFCIDLTICLLIPNPHPISWIVTGLFLGGAFIMLTRNKIINSQYDFINFLLKTNKRYFEVIDKHIIKIKGRKKK